MVEERSLSALCTFVPNFQFHVSHLMKPLDTTHHSLEHKTVLKQLLCKRVRRGKIPGIQQQRHDKKRREEDMMNK